jgi:hypothetical protein
MAEKVNVLSGHIAHGTWDYTGVFDGPVLPKRGERPLFNPLPETGSLPTQEWRGLIEKNYSKSSVVMEKGEGRVAVTQSKPLSKPGYFVIDAPLEEHDSLRLLFNKSVASDWLC